MSRNDPVEEYFDEKEKQAAKARVADVAAYEAWTGAGGLKDTDESKALLQPLISRFEPSFRKRVRDWKPPGVQESAFRLEMKGLAHKALKTYNPTKGASLNTWVNNYLKKVMRYAGKRQNIARIPEGPQATIGHITRASDLLSEQLGRTPTSIELHGHFQQQTDLPKTVMHELRTPKHIERIQGAQRADIPASSFESDPLRNVNPRQFEVISMIRPNLTTKEQRVYDQVYDKGVKGTGDIAKNLGISEQEVSKLKTKIIGKVNKFM